jgi:hypothetical protein
VSEFKVGDKVWVECEVVDDPCHGKVKIVYCNLSFWPYLIDCKPVEPEAVVKQSLTTESDPVNPSHYKQLPAETIDIIEAAIENAPSNKVAGLHWQVLKYALRCWFKNGIEDLQKARWYLDRLIQEEESK